MGDHRAWLDGISTVAAPMRLANARSASGGRLIVGGDSTRTQRFQAGTPITRRRRTWQRCCTAYITLCRDGIDVGGEVLAKSSSDSQPKPRVSG